MRRETSKVIAATSCRPDPLAAAAAAAQMTSLDSNPSTASTPSKPAVAIICNSHTPYRLHLHLRIAREIPQIKLWSVYTHEESNAPWAFAVPPEIGPISFGHGESSHDQAKVKYALREWRKG